MIAGEGALADGQPASAAAGTVNDPAAGLPGPARPAQRTLPARHACGRMTGRLGRRAVATTLPRRPLPPEPTRRPRDVPIPGRAKHYGRVQQGRGIEGAVLTASGRERVGRLRRAAPPRVWRRRPVHPQGCALAGGCGAPRGRARRRFRSGVPGTSLSLGTCITGPFWTPYGKGAAVSERGGSGQSATRAAVAVAGCCSPASPPRLGEPPAESRAAPDEGVRSTERGRSPCGGWRPAGRAAQRPRCAPRLASGLRRDQAGRSPQCASHANCSATDRPSFLIAIRVGRSSAARV